MNDFNSISQIIVDFGRISNFIPTLNGMQNSEGFCVIRCKVLLVMTLLNNIVS